MLDAVVPTVQDHCRVLIYVRQFGYRSATLFNCLLERLQRVQCLQVSDNPKRMFVANFVAAINTNMVKYGELQAHRRVIGFIGVVQAPIADDNEASPSEPSISPEIQDGSPDSVRKESESSQKVFSLEKIKRQYDVVKRDYESTLIDSRCIILGYPEHSPDGMWSPRELFSFRCLDEADTLENAIRDFLRSIYYVLESRRLDLSFEKLENPPYLTLAVEQKYRMGVENKSSKIFKRKCVGRLRKQVADYTLLTGLASLALDAYQSAIEYLKQTNDFLWLAAAYEGWACAAMACKYDLTEDFTSVSGMQRILTMTPEQMCNARKYSGTPMGHQRHRSDEDRSALAASVTSAQMATDEQQRLSFRLKWNPADRSSSRCNINYTEIVEKFKLALENYEKFSFVVCVEYECMMKASSVYRYQMRHVEMESFIRDHIGKYLDDGFNIFDHITKAIVCLNSAEVYREIGFNRKCAFYARLAVLFRLHVSEHEERSVADYRQVYPILYRTLVGYGMPENPKEFCGNLAVMGPVQIQRRALHEVFMSALRAEYHNVAIRHLCYLLQVYYDYMEREISARMLQELASLVTEWEGQHQLNQHISLPQHGLIIPPLQMTRFPRLEKFVVCPLPARLSATVIRPPLHADIFIYSPFQCGDSSSGTVEWVVDCACEVSVTVMNCLPYELSVNNLALISEGCSFEPVPVRLILAPSANIAESVDIKLIGVPREPGRLTITGYSCEVLGVKNVCRLRDLPDRAKNPFYHSSVFDIEVLPALPVLELQTSLSRAPISEGDVEPTAELTVYSGQTFEHTVSLVNTSETIAIRDVRLEIRQPKVCGGPCMIEIASKEWCEPSSSSGERRTDLRRIEPLERKQIQFRIFGIDPSAMAEDDSQKEVKEEAHSLAETEVAGEGTHDRIPFTGRLLTCEFIFHYRADIDGPNDEQYERRCRLPLAVSIVPAVTVAAWHVLPGDGPTTRYVVIDVTNSTEWDAELTYGKGKVIGVQPREFCRVPLLCECCAEVASNAFQEAASRASHMMQMQEMERLRQILERHVSSHLDINWVISTSRLSGSVPVGPLLSSVALLKQLVIPVISIEVSVNGIPYLSEDEVAVGIGEVVDLGLRLVSPISDSRSIKGVLQLQCYRDLQNGSYIESHDNMIVVNTESLPFEIIHEDMTRAASDVEPDTFSIENDYAPAPAKSETEAPRKLTVIRETFRANFEVLFRCEGAHKIRPLIVLSEDSSVISPEELYCSAISFNVITKEFHEIEDALY